MENKIRKRVLSASDTFLAVFLISPLVVAYWRGIWEIMNHNSSIFPGIHSFFFGGSIHLSFAILQDVLKETICDKNQTFCNKIKSQIVRKIYTYIFSIACIMHWRGGWEILDNFGEGSKYYVIIISGICAFVLLIMRCLKNTMAPPMIILLDNENVIFTFPTRFYTRHKMRDTCGAHFTITIDVCEETSGKWPPKSKNIFSLPISAHKIEWHTQ